jgi:GINS complex subunit 4
MTHFDPNGQDYLDEFDLGDKQELDHNDVGLGAFVTKKVEELHEVWQTEVNAPEILTYKKELVELIQKKLDDQAYQVDSALENTDEENNGDPKLYFSITLYQMDIERVRYALTRYLRARILKIEKHVDSILQDDDMCNRLSPTEKDFAETLYKLNNNYMNEQVKNRLDENSQPLYKTDDIVATSTPNLQQFVYYCPLEDVQLLDMNGKSKTVAKGTISIAAYGEQLKDKVQEGSVRLL